MLPTSFLSKMKFQRIYWRVCLCNHVSLLRRFRNDWMLGRAIGRKGQNHCPHLSAVLRNSSRVLLARYSALATIIIFSLGIWCHKFDLVISFTDCTRATKREENDGEDGVDARLRRKRKGQTMLENEHEDQKHFKSDRYPADAKKCYLVQTRI